MIKRHFDANAALDPKKKNTPQFFFGLKNVEISIHSTAPFFAHKKKIKQKPGKRPKETKWYVLKQ